MWYTPLIASLPPWWRLLQCLRRYRDSSELVHLANALKYTSSIVATIIGAVRKSHRKSLILIIVVSLHLFIHLWYHHISQFSNHYPVDIGIAYQFMLYFSLGHQNGLGSFTAFKSKSASARWACFPQGGKYVHTRSWLFAHTDIIHNRHIILLRFWMCVFDLHGWLIWCVCDWMVIFLHSFWQQWKHVVVYNGMYSDWKTRYVQQTLLRCVTILLIIQYV